MPDDAAPASLTLTDRMLRSLRQLVPFLFYVALAITILIAAMSSQRNLLFWVFGVLTAGLVLSVVLAFWSMRGLEIRRLDPQHGAVGEPLNVRYVVRNRKWILPVFNLHLEDQPVDTRQGWQRLMKPARAWIMHVGPGDSVHGDAVFWPRRRGEAQFLQLRAWTTFPFGLVRRRIKVVQDQHTLIFPRLYELRRGVLDAVTPIGILGTRISQHAGAGDDYYGLREYRPGDSLRHIAWKRSAQLGQIVCIERTNPSPPKIRVTLDLRTPTEQLRIGPDERLTRRQLEEQAISLAASLVHAAHESGYEVGLSLPGTGMTSIAIRRSRWHVNKIMAALASIDLDARRVIDAMPNLLDAERAGLVVIHPDRVTPLTSREDVLYLTGHHLRKLAIGALGWETVTYASLPAFETKSIEQAKESAA